MCERGFTRARPMLSEKCYSSGLTKYSNMKEKEMWNMRDSTCLLTQIVKQFITNFAAGNIFWLPYSPFCYLVWFPYSHIMVIVGWVWGCRDLLILVITLIFKNYKTIHILLIIHIWWYCVNNPAPLKSCYIQYKVSLHLPWIFFRYPDHICKLFCPQ